MSTDVLANKKPQAFKLKGSLFTLTVIQLSNTDKDEFAQQLEAMIRQAPKFFQHTPVVIDLKDLRDSKEAIDFPHIVGALRDKTMIPVGVRGGNPSQHQTAMDNQLAVLTDSRSEQSTGKTKLQPQKTSAPKPEIVTDAATKEQDEPRCNPTRVINQPVRSGQQIYAPGGDLIVMSSVSHGAEILADGNIHVYGTMRGRALAGINGNTEAKIICQSLDAELISIAGCYQVNEDLKAVDKNQWTHIYLKNEHLQIEAL